MYLNNNAFCSTVTDYKTITVGYPAGLIGNDCQILSPFSECFDVSDEM